jgi:hypothetical protein
MAPSIQKPSPLPRVMHTTDDVLKMLPDNMRPKKAEFEATVEASGCYHDMWGKKGYTDDDVECLFEYMRAKQSANAKAGPGRLFGAKHDKGAAGYMVFIGDQLGEEDALFVGFAPANGAGDLLRLVQFGNPGNLAILHFFPATPEDVTAHMAALKQWQYRTDNSNWFMRTKPVNAYIVKLRDDFNGPSAVEADDEQEEL